MEDKTQKNIFESEFESFELDDGFLLTVDADSSKYKINIKDSSVAKKVNHITVNKPEVIFKGEKVDDTKKHFEDLSIFLQDLNESDFFEKTISKNNNFPKVINITQNNKEKAEELNKVTCLSPILLPKSKHKLNRTFSSTPLKPTSNANPEEKKNEKFEKGKVEKTDENFKEIIGHGFLETGLFDDWDVERNSQKDSLTLSQAFKLIEEAESAKQLNQKEDLNISVDLLTGRPVGGDVEDLFAESFSLTNFIESKQEGESSDDCIMNSEESNSGSKFPAVQKMNFKPKTKTEKRKNNFANNFNSDDDFDFLTQELLKKPKCAKTLTELKGFDSDDSSENIRRRGKYCRIIESDSADDSPDFKFNRRCNKKKIRRVKNYKKNAAREFIESEAEVSDLIVISSDESEEEEEGSYDTSFIDEGLYLTQNCSENMTAKYLESVKSPNHCSGFKIPPKKPYCPAYVFSQIPEDNNTEYELDSFCVNEVEEEMKTDLSDLEIAEKILEMDRKKRKRNRFFKNR